MLRRPRERDCRRAGLRPGPIHPPVDLIRQTADLAFARILPIEIALAKEHPGEQQRRIHRRDLALIGSRAGSHVEEVIEEPLLVRCMRKEAQRGQHTLPRLRTCDIAALHADGIGSECKANCSDAGE